MPLALDDLTVLDLSHALAGPTASTMLADYGARVLKVEPPEGEMSRGWGPPFLGEESAYFVHLNRNKQSVVLDLKHPEGKELFLRLAATCDVVLENFRVGTLAKLGIDYAQASARNPRIIYCSISGFGQDGPWKDRAALDLIAQAEGGLMSITGEPDGRGVRCGVSIADITAGMNAAFGILTALRARERTGRGQHLDVSMLEGQLGLLDVLIGQYLADGIVPARWGTAYKSVLPYQTFRTRTQDLALAIGNDRHWRTLCRLLGLDDLGEDPRFATNAARAAHRPELVERLQGAFLTRDYDEWEAALGPAGIPVGAINTIDRVVEHPQVAARGVLVEHEHPVAGTVRLVGPRIRLSETPGSIRAPAPLLDEHTDLVLRERLGLDDAALARLRAEGAIGRKRA